jgi:low affinity Fe/Cu permease
MNRAFHKISTKAADWFGSPAAFLAALVFLLIWGVTGPLFHFSDTWQLIANTATNIITFLMVFVIQNSQNRDSKAIQLKLAELIRATEGTRNAMVNLEDLSDEQMARLRMEFEQLGRLGGTDPINDVAEIEMEDLEQDQLPPDTPSHPG